MIKNDIIKVISKYMEIDTDGLNIKKGTKELSNLLEKEACDAFEKRKNMARVKGEEATTKLLMPMMLMLITVMMIIMIPAIWSFRM